MPRSNKKPLGSKKARREIRRISKTASRLGVGLDSEKALQWIIAVSTAERESAFAQDAQTGVFGHRIALMDFDQSELDYFRRLAQSVRAARRPNIESAIAIAGSSAQGKVQLFPGDCDFFERVNIKADTLDAARETWRAALRETALRAFAEPDIVLMEADFGAYPVPVIERGTPRAAGHPIAWTPQAIVDGKITVQTAQGQPLTITWDEAPSGAGRSFLAWIVADRPAGQIALASNMMDVTWESPDGSIVALDRSIDPFFQEIYLEPAALPVFTKIVQHLEAGARDAYVRLMRTQVYHYAHVKPNYGKVSKRLYNLFRLTDRLEAAAYVRELFNAPGARLYQVSSLLEAANVALVASNHVDRDTVVRQIDHAIRAVAEAIEGTNRADLVMELIRLRDAVIGRTVEGVNWEEVLLDVEKRCNEIVNEYFRVRLFGLAEIETFVASLQAEEDAGAVRVDGKNATQGIAQGRGIRSTTHVDKWI